MEESFPALCHGSSMANEGRRLLWALTAPLQRNRPGQRMLHRFACTFGFKVCSFQLEIPFRGTVGVVDQHQVRIMLQAFGLKLHGAAVLLDKLCEDEFQQLRPKGERAENIPGS